MGGDNWSRSLRFARSSNGLSGGWFWSRNGRSLGGFGGGGRGVLVGGAEKEATNDGGVVGDFDDVS